MDEKPLDIGEVARRTGLAPSALRYYERLGLLESDGRNGLRRTYRPEVIDRIALIVNARATGFTLRELHELLEADPREVRGYLVDKLGEIDDRIATMQQARTRLSHGLTCRHDTPLSCPAFRAGLRSLLPA